MQNLSRVDAPAHRGASRVRSWQVENSVEVELPFGNCRILDLEALIRAKEAMNRDHDRITVKQLREIKRRR